MKNDYYNALHDIYFFEPINEKIREIIEETLDININISKLQGCVYEFCDENCCTLEECWLNITLELNIKGFDFNKDDILESFYIEDTNKLNVEMIRQAFSSLNYEV